ncbi:hypothetical protein OIV83_001102 [Microbotryomycetes sp. JL201]|nr:hypothetical protein OIV83_001102 [Microbotryomycetes sp. JL201]
MVRAPADSECVQDSTTRKYFCGYAGARCTSDSQCDFGKCSGDPDRPGQCLGGLGDPCEGVEGADDSLCLGNLGCSLSKYGSPVCGGLGAECLYTGDYVPGDTPNNAACVSGFCDKRTLRCAESRRPLKEDSPVDYARDRAPQIYLDDQDGRRPQVMLGRGDARSQARPPFRGAKDDDGDDRTMSEVEWHQLSDLADRHESGSGSVNDNDDDDDDEDFDFDLLNGDDGYFDGSDPLTDSDIDAEYAAYKAFRASYKSPHQQPPTPPPQAAPPSQADLSLEASAIQCPAGHTACPQTGLTTGRNKFGCFDTDTSVHHCGGCTYPLSSGLGRGPSAGRDCLAQEGVVAAGCVQGHCVAFACESTHKIDRRTGKCRARIVDRR